MGEKGQDTGENASKLGEIKGKAGNFSIYTGILPTPRAISPCKGQFLNYYMRGEI